MYTLGSQTFGSKADVTRYVKNILKRYREGQRLDQVDEVSIIDLIRLHPDAIKKMGNGISRIVVRKTPPFNSLGLWIVRIDETTTDFSYKICLNGDPAPRARFTAAARSAVQPIIAEYRDSLFVNKVICPMTGRELSIDDCHIDHAPPNYFSKIVDDFIALHEIDLNRVKYVERGDGRATEHFADKMLEQEFIEFHNARANLRAVDKEWNIKASNRSLS